MANLVGWATNLKPLKSILRTAVYSASKIELFEAAAVSVAAALGKFKAPRNAVSTPAPFDVDAVYLWVDDQDPAWQSRRAQYAPSKQSDSSSVSASRFRQFGELAASIQMLAAHASFIRNVFIVVDQQKPDLSSLPAHLPFEIKVVNHSDFIPAEYRPTYSSRAITANLHRIEGLAEHFLYCNDDVFVAKAAIASDWFSETGVKLRYTQTALPDRQNLASDEVIYNARYRTNDIAESRGWLPIEGMPEHGPHPFLKSVMRELWKDFVVEMNAVSTAKFRTADGLLPEWLHNIAALATGRAELVTGSGYKYIAVNDQTSLAAILDMLLKRGRILTVCLNDVSEIQQSRRLNGSRLVRRFKRVLRAMV